MDHQQQNKPGKETHELEETKGFLRCGKCGCSAYKRTNEAAFQAFVQGPCIDQAYEQAHAGRPSHSLWQKGERVNCRHCGVHIHLDTQQPIMTGALQKMCKGAAVSGSLVELFRRQAEKASQSQHHYLPQAGNTTIAKQTPPSTGDAAPAGHEPQPSLVTPQKMASQVPSASLLAPKKLTFSEATGTLDALHTTSLAAATTTEAHNWPGLRRRTP